MGKIANALESGTSSARSNGVGAGAPSGFLGIAATDSFGVPLKAKALAMLGSAAVGVPLADVARGLYGVADKRTIHNARSMLAYLGRKGEAHEKGGRWFVGVASNSRRTEQVSTADKSATPLVRRAFTETVHPLSLKEVMVSVLTMNPKTPKAHIYSALNKLKKRGEITKAPDGRYTPAEKGASTAAH